MTSRIIIVFGTAVTYYFLFVLNDAVFSGLGYSESKTG